MNNLLERVLERSMAKVRRAVLVLVVLVFVFFALCLWLFVLIPK